MFQSNEVCERFLPISIRLNLFHYRPKRSFGQGNIFTSVCHSFCSRGGVSGPGGFSNFSGGLQFFGGVLQFLGGLQFFGGVYQFFGGLQFWGGGSLHWNTVNVRPVRILLECILVFVFMFPSKF